VERKGAKVKEVDGKQQLAPIELLLSPLFLANTHTSLFVLIEFFSFLLFF
jgi:hypothetical protein